MLEDRERTDGERDLGGVERHAVGFLPVNTWAGEKVW